MKLNFNQLSSHLGQKLLPIYYVSGDEPLQLNEACDAIRLQARNNGFTEREILSVDKSFDWGQLFSVANSMSLFAEKRLIELRMPTAKPGDKGSKALIEYIQNLSLDNLLLIISSKVEKQTQRSKWYTQIEKVGACLQVWPVEVAQLAAWINQRMRARGMQPSKEVVRLLVERVEGNLLAAAQEIEKINLFCGERAVDVEDVLASVNDSSRYDLFDLVDCILKGDDGRIVRMLKGLRSEGTESILLLWALSRELRSLGALAGEAEKGMSIDQVVNNARHIWPKRKAIVSSALRRHTKADLHRMVQHAARIDRTIKGMAVGNVWDELIQLSLDMAGKSPFPSKQMNATAGIMA